MSWLCLLFAAVSTYRVGWQLLSGNQTANAVSVCGSQGIFSQSNIAPSLDQAGFFAADGVIHLVGGYPAEIPTYWDYNFTSGLWRCRNAPDLSRYSFQWAYDSSSRRLFLFSGISASDHWASGQSNFLTVNSTLGVRAEPYLDLHSGAMVLANESLYFFGGTLGLTPPLNTAGFLKRIDFFNGSIRSTLVDTYDGPPARTKHGMLFHQETNSIYLYGGLDYSDLDTYVRGDFWKFDVNASAWSQLHPHASRTITYPGARFSFGFAISQIRGQIFISGGANGMEIPYNDIWSYDIAQDMFQVIGGSMDEGFIPAILTGINLRPNGTIGQKLAFDEGSQRLFQWDGFSNEGNSRFNRLWEIIPFNATLGTTSTITTTASTSVSRSTWMSTTLATLTTTPIFATTIPVTISSETTGIVSISTTQTSSVRGRNRQYESRQVETAAVESTSTAQTLSVHVSSSTKFIGAATTSTAETNLPGTTTSDSHNQKTTPTSDQTSEISAFSHSFIISTSLRRGAPVVFGMGDNSVGLLLALIAAAVVVLFVPTIIAIHCYRAKRISKKQLLRSSSTLPMARTTTEDIAKSEMTPTRLAGTTTTTSMTTSMTGSTLYNTTHADMAVPAFLAVPVTDFKRSKQIAKGGSGTVFLAEGLSLDLKPYGPIIAKQIVDAHISILHQEISSAFFQEIAIMYLLREQRNIAKLLRYCVEPVVLIMKFYELGSVKKFLRGNILNKSLLFSLLSDIARGLNALHSNGIAHCDIKTDNVLLDRVKGKVVAVLTDFGISRVVEAKVLTVNEFKTSNMKALTFSYAAPEVIAAYRQRTLSSSPPIVKSGDIYSLGSIGYVMLTKKEPWTMN